MTKQNLKARTRVDDEDDDLNESEKFRYYKQALPSYKLVADFTKPIQDVSHYFELLEDMEQLTEDDVAIFKVASPGGHLSGALAIMNAIRNCEAPVIGELIGDAASAATLILLSCDGVRVHKWATMMIHGASFGAFGHQSNVVSHSNFVNDHARKLMTEVYQDFLTDEELADVFKGLEVRFNYEQILERLEKRDEIRKARYEQEHEEHGEIDLNDLEED